MSDTARPEVLALPTGITDAGGEGGSGFTAFTLQQELSRLSGRAVRLELTSNRNRMITVQREQGGGARVRAQRVFLSAPAEVVAEIAGMIRGIRGRKNHILEFARNAMPKDQGGQPRPARVGGGANGLHHNLQLLWERVNSTYLGDRSKAQVGWGRKSTRASYRFIRFASYHPDSNRIIVNRKLDRGDIPAYFMECLLFHEMLHEVLGIGELPDGRRDIHGSLFKLMESTHPDFEKAQVFEQALCRRLSSL